MLRQLLILLLVICYAEVQSQDTSDRIELVSGRKSKTIKKNRALTIHYSEGECAGAFQYTDKKALFLKPYYQLDKGKTLKFFSEKTDSIIQINLEDIFQIEFERSALGTTAALVFWGSLATAFIVSPIISIEKGGGFDTQQFLTISGISLGSALISGAVIGFFGRKTFELKPIGNKRIWAFKT